LPRCQSTQFWLSLTQVSPEERDLQDLAVAELAERDGEADGAKNPYEALRKLREDAKNELKLSGEVCCDRRNQMIGRMICAVVEPLKDLCIWAQSLSCRPGGEGARVIGAFPVGAIGFHCLGTKN
jgi:hypothetical protein